MLIHGGKCYYGEAIGIIVPETKAPLIPGDVANAESYDFPVRFKVLNGFPKDCCVFDDKQEEKWIQAFLLAAKELEEDGVRAVTTSISYFARHQLRIASELKIPLFTSPLLLTHLLASMCGDRKKLGIISDTEKDINEQVLEQVTTGTNLKTSFSFGLMEQKDEFYKGYIAQNEQDIDFEKIRKEVLEVSDQMLAKDPDIGAFILMSSHLATYSASLNEHTGLPIADYISLARLVYRGVIARQYNGIM